MCCAAGDGHPGLEETRRSSTHHPGYIRSARTLVFMLLKQEPWVFDTSEWKTVTMASQLCVRLWWWWSEVLTIWHYRNSNIIIITTTTLKMFYLQKRYKNKQCLSVSSVSTWKDRCVTGRIIFEAKWSYLVSQKRQDSALKFLYDAGS